MSENETNNESEILKETISPDDVIVDEETEDVEDDDTEMPQPQTKIYKKYLKCSDVFMNLFHKSLGTLPYNTILVNTDNSKMRLIDFMRYMESKKDKISIEDMNIVISYISQLDFEHARPIMEIIEDKNRQNILWSIFDD
jgi:uncharacterized protein YfaA (DUF2138 family)